MLILKLGDRGVLTCRPGKGNDLRSFFVVDSFADRVVDAVGAGDALLAYATLALVGAGSEVAATILGSVAAALECEVDGNLSGVAVGCSGADRNAGEARRLSPIAGTVGATRLVMRVVIIGLGVQGRKRRAIAGPDAVASVDPSIARQTTAALRCAARRLRCGVGLHA